MGSCQSRKQQAKEVVVPRPEGSSHDGGGEKTSSEYVVQPILDYRLREGNLTRNMVHIESPTGIQIEEVYDGVHDGLVLGSGNSGLVRRITHKATGIQYAVKCLDLGLVNSPEELGQLRDEITIMCQLDHPNIIRLKEVYETYTNIYMVQELCMGRDLIYRLDDQPDYHYTEGECARLVKQILVAVRYLHSKGVIHRDLKLENFLFLSTSSDSKLKMIDFGLSKHFKFGEIQHDAVGTRYTVAPEVILGEYDEKCDIWAVGVITYLLLSGDPPFGGCGGPESLQSVKSNILEGRFQFEPEYIWSTVSPEAKEFISSLLVTNPNNRPSARDAQKHRWLREWSSRNLTEDKTVLNLDVVKALVSFRELSDMKKLLCEVLSFTLLPDQIKDLAKEFEKIDKDGSGEISLKALKDVMMINAGAGSLGSLTEAEVEDIFHAMRIRKTDQRIHWHEFIAASLSQCQVDDRNLRLAFDRLDSDHKGYITFEDMMGLIGNGHAQNEDDMLSMWLDSIKACQSSHSRITLDDFILLMKGQTSDVDYLSTNSGMHELEHIPEEDGRIGANEEEELDFDAEIADDSTDSSNGIEKAESFKRNISSRRFLYSQEAFEGQSHIIPDNEDLERPVTVHAESDKGNVTKSLDSIQQRHCMSLNFTDFNESNSTRSENTISSKEDKDAQSNGSTIGLPKFPPPRRCRSVNDQQLGARAHRAPRFGADARRAMILPEHEHNDEEIEDIVKDRTKSILVVNQKLYRAHRQMRLTVLEASKRFEEKQVRMAHKLRLSQGADNTQSHIGPVVTQSLIF